MKESKAKAFMFTCIGILAICIAVQVTMPATAQSPEPTEVASTINAGGYRFVYMSNGDVYCNSDAAGPVPWYYNSNVFESAGVIANTDTSMGDVKRSFR